MHTVPRMTLACIAVVGMIGCTESSVPVSLEPEEVSPEPGQPPSRPAVLGLPGRIAFVSTREGNTDLWAVDADGGDLVRLTTDAGADGDPAWSPDGGRIAFVSHRDGARALWVMAADGSQATRRAGGAFEPTWSPDGASIAFRRGSSIAVEDLADGSVAELTADPGWNAQPSWSPDGGTLAFVSDRDAYDFVFNIYTMRADGTHPRLRTEGFGAWPDLPYYFHPSWSPDGRTLAFVRARIINESDLRLSVAVLADDGTEIRDLAWAGDYTWMEFVDPGALAWSPDGQGIAFTFRHCDLLGEGSARACRARWSIDYVSLDGLVGGMLIDDAWNPSWRR